MSGQAKVCTATNVTLYVDGEELPPVAIGSAPIGYAAPLDVGVVSWAEHVQAVFDANPMPLAGQWPAFLTPPIGYDDPLLSAAMRFVAARPGRIGGGALMRRFGIGRKRAGTLLYVLSCTRVCLGGPVGGVWRVNHQAWRDLQGGAA